MNDLMLMKSPELYIHGNDSTNTHASAIYILEWTIYSVHLICYMHSGDEILILVYLAANSWALYRA